MNYDELITTLIEAIKADKAIIQPWRNKASARIEEAQAFVRMGRTSTDIKPPAGIDDGIYNQPCICPLGAIDKRCTQHGILA